MKNKPCENCPFRSDKLFPLHPDRVRGIANELRHDGSFICHKTIHSPKQLPCIGAVSVLASEGDAMANRWVRMGARCGMIPWPIEHDVPVWASFDDYIEQLEIIND